MKIKKTEININEIKAAAKSAAESAKIAAQKTQDAAKSAAKNISEKAEDFSKFAERTAQEAKQAYMRIFDKPKLERLSSEITETKLKIMKKDLELKALRSSPQKNGIKIWQAQKDMVLLDEKLKNLTDEYNSFALKQAACQRLFEELNKNV